MVIKYAGNILKTFGSVLAILCTCFISMPLFDLHPTELFWSGVAIVCISIWIYSRPPDREGARGCGALCDFVPHRGGWIPIQGKELAPVSPA